MNQLVISALQKVEYTAKIGTIPPRAKPPEKVTACCSAMPTSKKRWGYSLAKRVNPVPAAIAAVTQQIRASLAAKSHTVLPNTEEKSPFAQRLTGVYIEFANAVELGGVLFRRAITHTLHRVNVDQHRVLVRLSHCQSIRQCSQVVAVNGSVVTKAHILKHGGLIDPLTNGRIHIGEKPTKLAAHLGNTGQKMLYFALKGKIGPGGANTGQVFAKAPTFLLIDILLSLRITIKLSFSVPELFSAS